jgi:apolipoprotein N-acyltransferase
VLGFVTGAIYFLGTVYWLVDVMRVYGGLATPLSILFMLMLVAYMAIYVGLFGSILRALWSAMGTRALLLAPAVWVATEYARGNLFSGFPWVLLGYALTPVLPVAQAASVVGVYGLSALVAGVNAALAFVVVGRGRTRVLAPGVAIAVVLAIAVWGGRRMADGALTRSGDAVRVGIVQGDVPQDEKWDPAHRDRILARYLAMTRQAAAAGARFVVWPESSAPFLFEEDRAGGAAIRGVARETHTSVLIGSDQVDPRDRRRFYNAAFLVDDQGRTAGVYRKIRLVPFGEYVPLQRLLFFVAPLVEAVSDFSPGDEVTMLPVGGRAVSTAICYEVVYPGLVRDAVLAGSQLLTTITNDAWYGYSSAPYQHFEQASLRAIEEGRYLVRAANTGISGVVDPYGRVRRRSRMFDAEVIVDDVRLQQGRTIYARIGDLAAFGSIALTVLSMGVVLARNKGDRSL